MTYEVDLPGTGGKIKIISDEELTFKPHSIEEIIARVQFAIGDTVVLEKLLGDTRIYRGKVINYAVDIKYGVQWENGVYSVMPAMKLSKEESNGNEG